MTISPQLVVGKVDELDGVTPGVAVGRLVVDGMALGWLVASMGP